VAVDVIVANVWMAILLTIAANQIAVDKFLRADRSKLDDVRNRAEKYEAENARIPELKDLMLILALGFGATGAAHLIADLAAPWFQENLPDWQKYSVHSKFFWLVISATIMGVILSFTKARTLQGAGAMKVGSVFAYILVAAFGTHMTIRALFDAPAYFLIGAFWMLIHISLLFAVAYAIKAPSFFLAVGSKANVGGAASAPVVAAAFHPSLAPVGALLAVVGYAIGTFGALFTGQVMQAIAGG
jgi:uncharacterized membrane protein